ncbi:MAG: GAF domain-containing SpoIIE family protein phosphatase [Calditrichaceae bacterium]
MNDHLNSFRHRHQNELNSDELDKRLLELSALFEISQTLNSSLNLKSILNTILLVPMGRMAIGRGIVLFQQKSELYRVETLKGLPFSLIDKEISIASLPKHPFLISRYEGDDEWVDFFKKFKIELILPLSSMREFKGIVGYGARLVKSDYTDEEIDFLSSLSNIAAPSIENARIFDKLNQVNRQLDQKIQELNTLFEIGNELNRLFDTDKILRQLSYSLMGQMLVNQFFVAQHVGGKLEIVYRKGSLFNDAAIRKCIDQCRNLPDFNTPMILTEDQNQYSKLYDLGIRVITPMVNQDQVRGFIFLGEKLDKSLFNKANIDFMSTLANIAIISLENARLFEETLEKKRMEEELNLAKKIQIQLLPKAMPEIMGYDIHGLNIPSKQVGGDYFDIIKISHDVFILTIADVSGKGMPASLLMSNLQAGLQTLAGEQYELDEITSKLNNLIYKNTSVDKYITFFIAKLNAKTHQLEYVNAGHNPPYLFRPDGSYQALDKGGIILGMMPDVHYETGRENLKEALCLTMFTDGVTEAMNDDEEPFDEPALIHFFRENMAAFNSQDLNLKLYDVLTEFSGDPTKYDDVTILTLKIETST